MNYNVSAKKKFVAPGYIRFHNIGHPAYSSFLAIGFAEFKMYVMITGVIVNYKFSNRK